MVQFGVESENGWRPAKLANNSDQLEWITVPGTSVTLRVMKGLPSVILRAFAADYNAYVEPLRDPDSASYTPTNSVATSNHLNGTGMDLNWDGPAEAKVFRYGISRERAFPGEMLGRHQELLDWYEGMIYCGGFWSIRDWMHHQMGYGTWSDQDKVRDFIARKIRDDGFSTYKRGGSAGPVTNNAVSILAKATGLNLGRAAQIFPQVRDGLRASECTNIYRIAMWLAQIGHESDNFNATEEYDKGDGGKTDRWKYLGRTWIQITWLSNYSQFSQWCYKRGLVPTPDYFVVNPKQLAEQKWAGLGPAWYWTVARSDINRLCDAGEFDTVTYRINGGYNGLPDRKARYQRALAVRDDLLALIGDEDDMASVPQDQWDQVFREQTQQHESLSPYRTPGEGKVGTWCRIDRNKDLMLHVMFVEHSAVATGDVDSIYRIVRSAAGLGADASPEFVQRSRQALRRVPQEFLEPALAAIEAEDPDVLRAYLKG